ncbi:beta-lactamase domain-containing protein [Roseibium sp. TrichSKD4]|uniref:quinoprotein relay system zinc metallohydrolase 2 n=1 Tax=Roseibium sp. TrichSKD4 TaxID=744980 RepID=UPI0001E56DBD|nr:quinoprotein relay system zinc metallohydrolase 2 [Roseibium sp. TrichSKD4]EFO30283.1 beta-lactamase domain-containing protein [Roseibium sp. TrichSKD4]
MFEIIVTICLVGDPDICRSQLIPGHETHRLDQCESKLTDINSRSLTINEAEISVGRAACREMPDGLSLIEVEPGVFVHLGAIDEPNPSNLGDVSNIGVVIGESEIAVIDTGGSRKVGEDLYRAIRTISDLHISTVILTHMHPDHVYGASVFADVGAKIVGHPDLKRALQDRGEAYHAGFSNLMTPAGFLGTALAMPEPAPSTLDLGERVLDLDVWPTAHSPTDLTVFDRTSGILFTGDLVFHEYAPALDGSLRGWRTALDMMAEKRATYIVPGHGGPVLEPVAGVAPLKQYLGVLEADTRSALERGLRIGEAVEEIGKSEAENWELFELFNTRNATVSYTELEWE